MSFSKLNEKTSQLILKDAVSKWASERKISNLLVFESFDLPSREVLKSSENIVLFGDFLASYLYFIENEIFDKKIYVLCEKAKLVLDSIKAKKRPEVLVINRYELFPKSKVLKSLPDFSKDEFDLVYSGRISRSKNIKKILYLVKELQKVNPRIGLKLVGEFDQYLNVSSELNPYQYSIKKEVNDLIGNIVWTKTPEVIQGRGTNDWLEVLDSTDVLISLSSYWMDDFSVSCAQAQQYGFPLVVSDVGGLSDLAGDNIIHIPYHLIGQNSFICDEEMEEVHAACVSRFLYHTQKEQTESRNSSIEITPPDFEEIVALNAFDYFRTSSGREVLLKFESIWRRPRTKPRKVLFLKTKEQNHWSSLIKISDQIQKFWVQAQDEVTELVVVDVDQSIDKTLLFNNLNDCKYIVAQALAENTIKALQLIRKKLKCSAPVIAYPHELPSVFYASLPLRKLDNFFNEKDIFIVHCESDVELTKKSFECVNVLKIPAGFVSVTCQKQVTSFAPKNLYYIGRVSEQKNIHTLLWAVSLLKDEMKGSKLHIYGHHDHFGSPNFGISGEAYLDLLGKLVTELKLEDFVEFHGHKAIGNWAEHMAQKEGIGVFPGIHADENFGYAPFDLLKQGAPVILTRWGGFNDLIEYFPQNTFPVDVYQSELGPCVNPSDLAEAIKKAISCQSKPNSPAVMSKLSRGYWLEKLLTFISEYRPSETKLKPTQLAASLIESIDYSSNVSLKARGWMLNGRVFKDYSDEKFHFASKAYGAKVLPALTQKLSLKAPWIVCEKESFVVLDPLKGKFKLSAEAELYSKGFAFWNSLLKN